MNSEIRSNIFVIVLLSISLNTLCMNSDEHGTVRREESARKGMMAAQKNVEEKLDATIAERQQQEEHLVQNLEAVKSLLQQIEQLKAQKK